MLHREVLRCLASVMQVLLLGLATLSRLHGLHLGVGVIARVPRQLVLVLVFLLELILLVDDEAVRVRPVLGLLGQAVVAASLLVWVRVGLAAEGRPVALLLLQDALQLRVSKLHQLEGLSVLLSHVVTVFETLEVKLEVEHLLVFGVVVEANDRHAVVELERERVHAVVDQDDVTQSALVEDAHVLDVEVGIVRSDAAGAEVSGLDQGAVRVQVVDDRVRVLLLTGCEDDHLEVLVSRLEAVTGERADVDAGQDRLGLARELDRDGDVWVVGGDVVDAVDQRLVEVEYDRLRLRRMVRLRQVDQEMLDLAEGRLSQISHANVEQGLHRLVEVHLLDIKGLFVVVTVVILLVIVLVAVLLATRVVIELVLGCILLVGLVLRVGGRVHLLRGLVRALLLRH